MYTIWINRKLYYCLPFACMLIGVSTLAIQGVLPKILSGYLILYGATVILKRITNI
jgi:hypothetical protein